MLTYQQVTSSSHTYTNQYGCIAQLHLSCRVKPFTRIYNELLQNLLVQRRVSNYLHHLIISPISMKLMIGPLMVPNLCLIHYLEKIMPIIRFQHPIQRSLLRQHVFQTLTPKPLPYSLQVQLHLPQQLLPQLLLMITIAQRFLHAPWVAPMITLIMTLHFQL